MTILRQDALDWAAMELQIAANIRAQITAPVPQHSPVLYYAYRTAELRADALKQIAPTLPVSAPDVMPPVNPGGSYSATGNVIQVDFDGNSPGRPTPGWNSVFADLQQQATSGFTNTNGQSTPIYKPGRPNYLESNYYGEGANPSGSGIVPNLVMQSNHTGGGSYVQNDVIRGLNPNLAYDVTFYGSRMADSELTQFTVGDSTKILDTSHNTQRGVTFAKVRPSPTGALYWSWSAVQGTDTEASAMAALIITEFAPA